MLLLSIFIISFSLTASRGWSVCRFFSSSSSSSGHYIQPDCPPSQFYCFNQTTNRGQCLQRNEFRCWAAGNSLYNTKYHTSFLRGDGCKSSARIDYCGSWELNNLQVISNGVIQGVLQNIITYTVYLGATQLTGDPGPRNIRTLNGWQLIHMYIMYRGFIYDFGKTYNAREIDPNDWNLMRTAQIDANWFRPLGKSWCARGSVCFLPFIGHSN